MQYSYLIIDDNAANVKEILNRLEGFSQYFCVGAAATKEEAINKLLELQPRIVFLTLDTTNRKNGLSLSIITEIYRFVNILPYFIILSITPKFAFKAIKAGVSDYLLRPLDVHDLKKSLLKFEKTNPEIIPETICIKSYSDYQFVNLNDIVYLKADNNTTDFFLQNGRKLAAYKTLKYYEASLPPFFFRIHKSYIVNSKFISRINTGKGVCYLNNSDFAISFSKTFKNNIDIIIRSISPKNL